MDKDQAIEFVIHQYTLGHSPASITQELSQQMGAPASIVSQFVSKTISQNFPDTFHVAPAVATPPAPVRRTPRVHSDFSLDVQEDDDDITPLPTYSAAEMESPLIGRIPAGVSKEDYATSVFLTGQAPGQASDAIPLPGGDGATMRPAAYGVKSDGQPGTLDPSGLHTTEPERLRLLEQDPELEALVLKSVGRNIKMTDTIMMVCEQHGVDWRDAQRIVARIQARNRHKIRAQQNRIIMPLIILAIISGLALIVAALIEFIQLQRQLDAGNTAYVAYNFEYLLREVLPWGLVGLGLLSGGIFGLVRSWHERNN